MYEEIRRKTDYGVGYELLRIDPKDRKAIIRSDDGGKTWQTIDHKNIRMKGLRQTDTEIEYLGEDGRWYHKDAWGNTKLELTYEEQSKDREAKRAAKKAAKKAEKEQKKEQKKQKNKKENFRENKPWNYTNGWDDMDSDWDDVESELAYNDEEVNDDEEESKIREPKKVTRKATKIVQKEEEEQFSKIDRKSGCCLGTIILAPFKLFWWVVKWIMK